MQNKENKTTTINIDKINEIENENVGFVISDELKEQLSSLSRITNDISESFKKTISILPQLGLGTWFTPEMQEALRLFGERIREKKAIEVDRYNNKTHLGMSKRYGFDYLLLTEKEKSDFFKFVLYSFDREDERWELPVLNFIKSITDREWQDCGMKYYVLQKKQSFDRIEEFEKQLSAPLRPKEIGRGSNKSKYPAIVVMEVARIIDKIKDENFLPDETDFEKKVKLTITAISDKLDINLGNGIRNHFKPNPSLNKKHREKVCELLKSLGYKPQAKEFELKYRGTNR